MNVWRERHVKSLQLAVPPVSGRHRFRFHTRHLLALMACAAIAIAALNAIKKFGYTRTTVEIINYYPTWGPTGSVEFKVRLPNLNGFSYWGFPVPTSASSIDYSKLVGSKFPMEYRVQRFLWLPPRNQQSSPTASFR